ncbi:MAG: hypothetical protein Tsb0019_12190 [Roseibium sp.]
MQVIKYYDPVTVPHALALQPIEGSGTPRAEDRVFSRVPLGSAEAGKRSDRKGILKGSWSRTSRSRQNATCYL